MSCDNIQNLTEEEFIELVKKICFAEYETQRQHGEAVYQFNQMSEHPDGSDLIYYPKTSADHSPEGIVKEVKEWRAANGKPGFKSETLKRLQNTKNVKNGVF